MAPSWTLDFVSRSYKAHIVKKARNREVGERRLARARYALFTLNKRTYPEVGRDTFIDDGFRMPTITSLPLPSRGLVVVLFPRPRGDTRGDPLVLDGRGDPSPSPIALAPNEGTFPNLFSGGKKDLLPNSPVTQDRVGTHT